MNHCRVCGRWVPDSQNICSECYGDPTYGSDGYLAARMEEEREQQRECQPEREGDEND